MPFLSSEPELSMTPFSKEQLAFARSFLSSMINETVPTWLVNPVGYFARYWKDEGFLSTCSLIDISYKLDFLKGKITQESLPIFAEKIKHLLRIEDEKQYQEIITELKFANLVSHRVDSIILEPLTVQRLATPQNRSPSPDFAALSLDQHIYFEITVLYLGASLDWDKSVDHLSKELDRLLIRRGVRRVIVANLPLSFNIKPLLRHSLPRLANDIYASEYGSSTLFAKSDKITVQWEPPLHIVTNDNHPNSLPQGVRYITYGPAESVEGLCIAHTGTNEDSNPPIHGSYIPGGFRTGAVFLEAHLSDSAHDRFVFNSLTNTIARKRHQFRTEAPYVLAMQLGSRLLKEERIVDLIRNRIWPNAVYEWLSAICLFKPSSVATPIDLPGPVAHYSPSSASILVNPNAQTPIPTSLLSFLVGKSPKASDTANQVGANDFATT
jgi:hypothetical protein